MGYDDHAVIAAIVGEDENDRATIKRIITEQTQLYKVATEKWKHEKNHTFESSPNEQCMVRDALEKEGFMWIDIDYDFSLSGYWC